jgi:hypothetical protein
MDPQRYGGAIATVPGGGTAADTAEGAASATPR